jgi:hypothetical protein
MSFHGWGLTMTVTELLRQAGAPQELVLKEHGTLLALSKLGRYEAECSLFEAKYQEPLSSFRQRLQSMNNQEDFEADDDLVDWEFADRAVHWWRETLAALRHAD